MNQIQKRHKYIALVTGFGPFGDHNVNASWAAVKELEKLYVKSNKFDNVKLVIEEIPVSYEDVSTRVPELWKEHDPIVVLHVGVSKSARCLTIESQAHGMGYVRMDVCNRQPDETKIFPQVLRTQFDIKEICGVINEKSQLNGCRAQVSHDAGRYLCEYIFYQSLSIKPSNTMFIHVPDFDTYSSLQTAQGLFDILCYTIVHKLRHGE